MIFIWIFRIDLPNANNNMAMYRK